MELGTQQKSLCDTFQRNFLCSRRLPFFPWHDFEQSLKSDPLLVLQILQKTILHPLCQKYPPSLSYRRVFLSELIKKYECTGADPLDELYDALAEVLNSEETTKCYKNYLLPSGESVTLSENVAIISEGTTGLVTWEAALSLAEWSIENKDIFRNRSILELGSGIGLTGLVICKSCSPKKYIFSDCHYKVLQQLRENIYMNGYHFEMEEENAIKNKNGGSANPEGVQISVVELNWELATEQQLFHLQADVVIASDVVYDPEIILAFSKVLKRLFSCVQDGRRMEVFVASTIRSPDTYKLFQTTLDKAGLKWQVLPHQQNIFSYDPSSNVEILNLSLNV